MKSSKAQFGLMLKGGVSVVALTAMAATLAAPALAQDAAPATAPAASDAQEVVVVGVRRSLKTAQQIKKDADTVVDSITANDIGSFPDKSVAEALQRVAGITVNRFAATGDTAHFSAEPSGVAVRGLQQVRSEFNGRDIFTADSSRGLSWSDVSPELMGGVDTYKNQTAELIEGGIAGSINLRTRLPFDQKGRLIAFSADYVYGDLAQKGTPAFSGIYSNRWDTSIGEFGFMANAAYSKTITNSQGDQLGRIGATQDAAIFGTSHTVYIPGSISLRDNTYDRERTGVSLASQWQNHDHTMLATLQYNSSKKTENWEEYVATSNAATNTYGKNVDYISTGDDSSGTAAVESRCATGTTCTFDSNGYFQSGELQATELGVNGVWYGTVPQHDTGKNLICAAWEACGQDASGNATKNMGTVFGTNSRYSTATNDTKDASFNFKWDPTEKLKLNFDVQYVKATQYNYDMSTALATYANSTWDLTGKHPSFTVTDPSSVNLMPGLLANPANYHMDNLMDHVTDSSGHEAASRLDMQYSFDSPWLASLKAGVRYSDREQTVRWSTYNWQSVVHSWASYTADNYFIDGKAFPDQNAYGTHTFKSDFYGGGLTDSPTAVYVNIDALKDRSKFADTFGNQNYKMDGGDQNAWVPICRRASEIGSIGRTAADVAANPNTGAGCFAPAEIAPVKEKTTAAYLELKFGGPDAHIFNSMTVSGNVGVRYVETTDIATGGINFSNSITYATTPTTTQETFPGSGVFVTVVDPTYYVSADDRKFLLSDANVSTVTNNHKNWLPSFNVKVNLTDKWILRLAVSRAMSRPDIGYLKSYISMGAQLPTQPTCANGGFTCNGNTIVKTNLIFKGDAQNPALKPVTADQIDLSLENYFASVGSFTFNAFYKKFHDYIQYGNYVRTQEHNGVTREVQMTGPVNGEGASVKGFEVAYQRFFDFLPAPFDGLGVQANYTHLHNTGIVTSNLTNVSGNGGAGTGGGGIQVAASHFNNLPLEGLSDDTYNLIGMYEKGSWSARLAYNWRSAYLVTAADCCIAFPIWQRAAGYLDGRIAYRINSNIEMSLEGSNLLGTETILMQQVSGPTDANPTGEKLLLPNAWFTNDKRLQVSIRLKY